MTPRLESKNPIQTVSEPTDALDSRHYFKTLLQPSLEKLFKKLNDCAESIQDDPRYSQIGPFLECFEKYNPKADVKYVTNAIAALLHFDQENNLISTYLIDNIHQQIKFQLTLIENKKVDLSAKDALKVIDREKKIIKFYPLNFDIPISEAYAKVLLENEKEIDTVLIDNRDARELDDFLFIMHSNKKPIHTLTFSKNYCLEHRVLRTKYLAAESFKRGIKHLDITNLSLYAEGKNFVVSILKDKDCTLESLTIHQKIKDDFLSEICDSLKHNTSLVNINLLTTDNDPLLLAKINKRLLYNFKQAMLPVYQLLCSSLIADLALLVQSYLKNGLIMVGSPINLPYVAESWWEVESKEVVALTQKSSFEKDIAGIFETLQICLENKDEEINTFPLSIEVPKNLEDELKRLESLLAITPEQRTASLRDCYDSYSMRFDYSAYNAYLATSEKRVLTQMALIFNQKKEYPQALQLIKKASNLVDESEVSMVACELALAYILFSANEYKNAVDAIDIFLKSHPNHKEAILIKARSLLKLKKFEDAIEATNHGIHGFVGKTTILQSLFFIKAKCLLKLNRCSEALSSVELGSFVAPLNKEYLDITQQVLNAKKDFSLINHGVFSKSDKADTNTSSGCFSCFFP